MIGQTSPFTRIGRGGMFTGYQVIVTLRLRKA